MKRPAFQFYPADWRKDAALQSCSISAQGLWINLLCIAHECEPYGHLTVNGQPMVTAQIARLVGLPEKECARLLDELLRAGVASKTADGETFSRRMVRDERVRNVRAESGRLGGNPILLKHKVNPKPTPSSSSSSSASARDKEPSVLPASPLRVDPEPPPAFDGKNSEALNGKAVVALSGGWELPETWGVDAESLGWKPSEVLYESEKFRQYWTAAKGAGQRKSVRGWRQAWSNWLGKAAERKR